MNPFRAVLENSWGIYKPQKENVDSALKALSELVLAEKLEEHYGDKVNWERNEAWNNALDHLSTLILGG